MLISTNERRAPEMCPCLPPFSRPIIEKDYYITEALRAIAAHAGDKVIFKGGRTRRFGLCNRWRGVWTAGLHSWR